MRWTGLALGAVLLAACANVEMVGPSEGDEVGAVREGLAVPGRWQAPPDVVARANAQRVTVVDPPAISPGGSCSSTWSCTHSACVAAHPGTADIAAWILREFQSSDPADRIANWGTYSCRKNTNNLSHLSVHSIGRAIDIGVAMNGGDANNSAGDRLANFLIEHAEHIGIQRVGWDGRWYNGERGFGASDMCRSCQGADYPGRCQSVYGCDPHVNHLHIEVSLDAAARRTAFFTHGPPGETCPVVCYGNAAVREDCSYVNCEDTGEVCRPDPVRCVSDEPPLASFHADAPAPTLAPYGDPLRFMFTDLARVFDTRPEGDASRLIRSGSGPLGIGEVAQVRDWPEVLPNTGAVWLNVAAVAGAGGGHVQVSPTGLSTETSSVNYQPNSVRNNSVLVPLGDGDGVDFTARGAETDLVADLLGAFAETGAGLRSVAPRRIFDSRGGAQVPAETPYPIAIDAPSTAVGLVATMAVINEQRGFVQVYACDEVRPESSSVNYEGLGVVASTVVTRISRDREICVWSTSPVDVILDATGYLEPGELSYQPIEGARLLDTRQATGRYRGRVGAGQVVELPIQSLAGAPAGIQSVVVNITSVGADAPGFITAYPCGFEAPLASAVNLSPERAVVSAVAFTSIGDGKLCLRSHDRTHLVVDLLGVWVPQPGGMAPSPSTPPEPPDPRDDDEEGGGGSGGATGDAGVGGGGGGSSGDGDGVRGGVCAAAPGRRAGFGAGPMLLLLGLGLVVARRRRAR